MVNATTVFIALSIVFVVVILLALRRRARNRALVSTAGRLSNVPKPRTVSGPGGLPSHYQGALSPPPAIHATYNGHSRLQRAPTSPIRTIPQPIAPRSPAPTRVTSGTTSRPISSVDPTLSLRSSVHRSEPITLAPSSPTSPSRLSSPRTLQRVVAESPLPSATSPPLPQRPSAVAPPGGLSPFTLVVIPTGASHDIEDPPPAYTPN